MVSDLTKLHAKTRSAELHRRAEHNRLHRLEANARPSDRDARPARPSRPYLTSPANAVRWTAGRVSAGFAALR
jgi:hypothetical protein